MVGVLDTENNLGPEFGDLFGDDAADARRELIFCSRMDGWKDEVWMDEGSQADGGG